MKTKPSSATNKRNSKTNHNTKSKLFAEKQSQNYMNKNATLYPKINPPKPNSIEEKDLITEKELLIQERYQLKLSINSLNDELSKYKTENVHLSLQLSQREKELDDIISANPQQKEKIMQSILISKLKAKYKEQSAELNRKEKEILELRKTKGYCNESELKIENEQLTNQLSNLAEIYKYSTNTIAYTNYNGNELNAVKEMMTHQHCIIKVLEEKLKETERDVRLKKKEIEEVKQKFEGKNIAIQKLENDNKKLQLFIKRTIRDEVGENDWQTEKKEYIKKIAELEENANHYKSLYVNVKDSNNKRPNDNSKVFIDEHKNQFRPQIKPINNPNIKNPEEITDKQILLLKSIIKELRDENKELKGTVKIFSEQNNSNKPYNNANADTYQKPQTNNQHNNQDMSSDVNNNTKVISDNDNTHHNIEITFEDILLLNLSAKNINESNAKKFFSSIVNQQSIDESSQEEIITNITNTLSIMLNCSSNQKDKDALYNYFNKMFSTEDIDDFCDNFYAFFEKVDLYSFEQERDKMSNEVNKELTKHLDLINSLMRNFPQAITIQNLANIFNKNGVNINKELFLFLCYEMKFALTLESLVNKDCSMLNLKTDKLEDFIQLKVLDEGLKENSVSNSKNEYEKKDEDANDIKDDNKYEDKEEDQIQDEDQEENEYEDEFEKEIKDNNSEKDTMK